jgi:hypothetical protein
MKPIVRNIAIATSLTVASGILMFATSAQAISFTPQDANEAVENVSEPVEEVVEEPPVEPVEPVEPTPEPPAEDNSGTTTIEDIIGGDSGTTPDGSNGSPNTAVPEPATILGTLAFSTLGGSAWLKRKRKQGS